MKKQPLVTLKTFSERKSKLSISKVTYAMIEYFGTDTKRINHLLKVHSFAKVIGECEHINEDEQALLEVAALTHDIGIKISEEKFNSSSGEYQQQEGPKEAEKLLLKLNFEPKFITDVCYLIAHHHTYNNIDSIPYQILVEADFIVNIFEDNMNKDSVKNVRNKIFKTNTGKNILDKLYLS